MTFRQTFWLDGLFVGEATRQPIRVHGTFPPPKGLALFCPICSTLWFNAPVDGQTTDIHPAFCQAHRAGTRHGSWSDGHIVQEYHIPGAVWKPTYGEDFLAALPEGLLRREFDLTMKAFEEA